MTTHLVNTAWFADGVPDMHAGNFAILMTDVQGSTYLWSIDQEGMWEALNIHHRVITDAVERSGGQIFTTAGDSLRSPSPMPTRQSKPRWTPATGSGRPTGDG